MSRIFHETGVRESLTRACRALSCWLVAAIVVLGTFLDATTAAAMPWQPATASGDNFVAATAHRARVGAEFAADMVVTYFGGKELVRKKVKIPSSPARAPEEISDGGARVWKDKEGRVVCLKLSTGPVFQFKYDKDGAIKEVVEPNGAVLARRGKGREWVRTDPDGKKTPVYGMVLIGNDKEVVYLSDSGTQTTFNPNGYTTQVDNVDGKDLIVKVVDPRGKVTEFSYDADGKPLSVKTADGFVLLRSEADKWVRTLPGTVRETPVPYSIERDEDSGNVVFKTPSRTLIYGAGGVAEGQSENKPGKRLPPGTD